MVVLWGFVVLFGDEGFGWPGRLCADWRANSDLDAWVGGPLIWVVNSSVNTRHWSRSIFADNVVSVPASDNIFD